MLGIDRPGDDQRDISDAVPDAPHSVRAASAERCTVLTDARARQDYALAYRAKVDAIYERVEREAARGNADQRDDRPNIVDRYPDDYRVTDHEPPRIDGPHEPPEKWVDGINFDENRKGRNHNCGECARAVQSTWQGEPATAAAISRSWDGGESPSRMAEWADQEMEPVSMTEIGRRLAKLGPGSSAIIGCDWASPRYGGHWFNAVNDSGAVKAVDGQLGKVEPWPPSMRGLEFDESMMQLSDALFFTPNGKVVRNDHS
jgi:Papain fold toxin 1, glutamine deamidase